MDRMQDVSGGQRKVMGVGLAGVEMFDDHGESMQGPSMDGDRMGEKGSQPPPVPPHCAPGLSITMLLGGPDLDPAANGRGLGDGSGFDSHLVPLTRIQSSESGPETNFQGLQAMY